MYCVNSSSQNFVKDFMSLTKQYTDVNIGIGHWHAVVSSANLAQSTSPVWLFQLKAVCFDGTMFVRQSIWRDEAHFLQPLFTFKVGLCTPIPSGSPNKLQPFCKILKQQNTYPVMDKLLKFHTYYYIDNTHPKIFPWLSISILVPPTHQWLWSAWMPISHSSFILKKTFYRLTTSISESHIDK